MTNTQKFKIFGATKRKGFAGYDIIGNIMIVKFDRSDKLKEKKKFALKFLKEHKSVSTVLEKVDKFKGRLRTHTTKFILGENTKEALYKENGCTFRLNVGTCYFSPRLNSERKEIALKVKRGENVLIMFGGVAPFAVVMGRLSKAKKIVSVELSRECNKYALINVRKNKLENVEIIQGDVRKRVPLIKEKFDRIVMARPQLKDTFLDVAFKKIKNHGVIHYYDFYLEAEKDKMIERIKEQAKKAGKKIDILNVKKAGEIGVKRYRYRTDLMVL